MCLRQQGNRLLSPVTALRATRHPPLRSRAEYALREWHRGQPVAVAGRWRAGRGDRGRRMADATPARGETDELEVRPAREDDRDGVLAFCARTRDESD